MKRNTKLYLKGTFADLAAYILGSLSVFLLLAAWFNFLLSHNVLISIVLFVLFAVCLCLAIYMRAVLFDVKRKSGLIVHRGEWN